MEFFDDSDGHQEVVRYFFDRTDGCVIFLG